MRLPHFTRRDTFDFETLSPKRLCDSAALPLDSILSFSSQLHVSKKVSLRQKIKT